MPERLEGCHSLHELKMREQRHHVRGRGVQLPQQPQKVPECHFPFQAQEGLRAEEPEPAASAQLGLRGAVETEQTHQRRDGGAQKENREPRTGICWRLKKVIFTVDWKENVRYTP